MANSTGSVLLDYHDPLNFTVACLLLVIGVFGVICNSSIVYIFYKEKSERTSFNLICVFRSLSNIYILGTTFLGLFLPKTILGYSPYSPPVESTLIHISNTLYLGNEYQIILVAINRFIAMFFPLHYAKLCGFKTTLILLITIYSVRIVIVFIETIEQHDFNYHNSYNMIVGVSMGLIGLVGVFSNFLVISTYIKSSSERTSFNTLGVARAVANLYIMIVLYGVVFIPTTFLGYTPLLSVPLTALTITVAMALYACNENQTFLTALNRFCALYFPFHYSKFCGMKPTVNKSRTDAVSRRKEKKNILLFFQTILQDFLYVIDFAFTFYLSQLIKHRLWTFLSGSLIWQMIHAIDGLIMIIFNEKISFLKNCFKKPSSEQPSNIHYDAKRNSISAALATIN